MMGMPMRRSRPDARPIERESDARGAGGGMRDGDWAFEVVRERIAGVGGDGRGALDVVLERAGDREGVDAALRAGLRAGVGGAVEVVRDDDAAENVGEAARWECAVEAVDIDGVRCRAANGSREGASSLSRLLALCMAFSSFDLSLPPSPNAALSGERSPVPGVASRRFRER